ncbi:MULTISPECIES: 4-hydroxy-tetrahydrodipicolinate reductase [unclassified Xanthobacter]|uniref:4-hydroxy-tetrahydrodipicolinate reductase n=1 Tax=unclassified Xanthobacter TaxID=2623496 RepID=UPI001EDD0212
MSELRIVIAGAGGRMGRALIKAVAEQPGLVLAGALEHAGSSHLGEDAGVMAGLPACGITVESDAAASVSGADVVIDFSSPAASVRLAERLAEAGIAHVIGTTGFSPQDNAAVAAAARRTAVVKSGNMSLGVNLLAALTRRVAATLDESFDIEILEMHHNRKVDAPSGTALLLGEAAADGRGRPLDEWSERGRDGLTGPRKPGAIGFASLRGGSVVGEHAVIFAGPAERIELVHKAEDRMIFAHGALVAARWVKGREPGLYSMTDVLGLSNF